ncbi:class I SAM-dependent methyltransferase [Actinophytocola sp.]|uniref:class I SAM-dependent methyltransferase n=1 Tax=Actinophytocola sp. TaxID=1872138 RepID=UPI002D8039CB|nr:class I SAM-dependent methyltransferase [Actinophytocola sp.]HET9144437.1 class I SAM-dependent methyltransferase [Actinophytocola sp.]
MTRTEFPPEWLALRAGADAAARSTDLLDHLRPRLTAPDLVIRDLGCGTGAMCRWLAERLPGRQHWILTDRDPDLLARAAAALPAGVTAETDLRDITRLTPADLAGTSLVTASALLDLFTSAEVAALAATCVSAAVPALFTLSVTGRVDLTPADPLDLDLAAAFNAHQRRVTAGRRLLGPDAADAAAAEFTRLGATVRRHPTPWHLGPAQSPLTAEWLRGWVSAAVAQQPDLAPAADPYLARRLAQCTAGHLTATVHHEDLLALP